jgi:hypothetical protein
MFATALKLTWPAPIPLEALVNESQGSLAVADHAHPAVVVIVTDPFPPPEGTAWLAGLIENVHAAAAWFTVKVCPPMVIVPTRAAVVAFADTLKVTGPVPAPVEAPVIESHPALTVAVQAHPAVVVIVTDPAPPAAATAWLAGLIENTQGAAACVTVKICPPTVIVPMRAVVVGFAAAVKLTVPEPVPLALVSESHAALSLAAHAQPAAVVIVTDPVPPAAATESLSRLIENVHSAAAWVTVKVCPAIVSVPVRTAVVAFGVTLKLRVPAPVPEVAPVIESQGTLADADQRQPTVVDMFTKPEPPVAATARPASPNEYWHGIGAGVGVGPGAGVGPGC